MNENQNVKVMLDSPSAQSHLSILQSVIARMATNSASCKTWCVTLVSAIVVVVADKANANLVWVPAIPIVLFLVLDSYYLHMERLFRDGYNEFVRKLHFGSANVEDIFYLGPRTGISSTSAGMAKAASSISVWPFYGLLALLLVVMRFWVLKG